MPSVTSWTRLEPHPAAPDLPGFAARVGDPLWLLARQWQLGELTGTDGGSPVRVDLASETAPLTRWLPGLPDGTAGAPLDLDHPLETVVEAEPAGALDDRAAAAAGADLLARLGPLGEALRSALVGAYPLPLSPPDTPPVVRRRADLLRRRVPDGRRLAVAVRAAAAAGDASTALPGLDRGDPNGLRAARAAALAWLSAAPVPPAGATPAAWRGERLYYEFAVAAPGVAGEAVLVAPEYGGGRLDWWALEAAPGASLGAAADAGAATTALSVLPTRVSAPGLPAARFWELESGDVNLEAVTAGPQDLGRLLFMEFAVASGGDHFAVPLPVPVGSVTALRRLTVTTTFGETVVVPAAEEADTAAGRAPFQLLQPSTRDGGVARLLVVLPTAVGALRGAPVEEVVLSRDEMADLAWAVERSVPGPDGRAADRAEALHRAAPPVAVPDPAARPGPPALAYRLVTAVPANWLPLLPATTAGRPVLRLTGPAPAGTLLAPGYVLHAERLSRAGLRVQRRPVRARGADGRPLTWMSRQVTPGRGESASGLRFDDLVPPAP